VNDAVSEPALIERFELRADVVWHGALAAIHHDRWSFFGGAGCGESLRSGDA
jgi:hypothetical protein